MLTAQQARELAGKTAQEYVDDLMPHIEKAARDKKREFATGNIDTQIWAHGAYDARYVRVETHNTKIYKEAASILEQLGYTVDFYYRDCSMAADIYTIIRW